MLFMKIFKSCVQSVGTYVDQLQKKLTSSCELGALTDEFIHKWFVIGVNDRDLKSKLLRQKGF